MGIEAVLKIAMITFPTKGLLIDIRRNPIGYVKSSAQEHTTYKTPKGSNSTIHGMLSISDRTAFEGILTTMFVSLESGYLLLALYRIVLFSPKNNNERFC